MRHVCGLLAAAVCGTHVSWGAMPQVDRIAPLGGTRGQDLELHLHGVSLGAARDMLWYDPGIETLSVRNEGDENKHVIASLRIAPDCALGTLRFRLYTHNGLSDLKLFAVGPYPQVEEIEPNHAPNTAQVLTPGTTVEGKITNEDVDYFRFDARRGERISIELEAVRLGHFLLDGYLAVLDTNQFEIAACDDSAQFLQDPVVSFLAPYDGPYVIEVRESSYGGDDQARYRLHLGHHPRPAAVFPPGGKPGESLNLTFLGDPAGSFTNVQVLTGETIGRVTARVNELDCPSPVPVRVSPLEWFNEIEPNDNRAKLDTNNVPSAPLAVHGVIGWEDDQDWFAFRAAKGDYDLEVFARRLGAPLDPVVNVFLGSGKHMKGNDDGKGMDTYFRWNAPEDGQYFVKVNDHLNAGSSNDTYRLEIRPVVPKVSLNFVEFKRLTQQRQHIVVPRGNRTAALLGIKRDDFGGEVVIDMPELPPGVTASVFPAAGDLDRIPVIFEATTHAALGAVLIDLVTRQSGAENGVNGRLFEEVELVRGNPNNAAYFTTHVDRAALAVVKRQKFRVVLEQPTVPIVHGGTLTLTVHVQRDEGFDSKIRMRMLADPPGITAPAEVTIEPGKSRAELRLSAAGAAGSQTRKIVVIAAEAGPEDATWISSEAVDLITDSPHVSGEMELTVVQQAADGELYCKLNHHRPFEGEAVIRLIGLPKGVTAPEQRFTNGTPVVRFPLSVAADAACGQHKNLFCHVDVPMPGGRVGQSIASGGTLRVDAPNPAHPEEAAVVKATPAPAPETQAPLSRLDQLRQRQKQGTP